MPWTMKIVYFEQGTSFLYWEMVYKSMFNDYSELKPFKELASLHDFSEWSTIYDPKVLKTITWDKVPIVAATTLMTNMSILK